MPHRSASQLGLLSGCPRQWRSAYVEGIKRPRTVDLLVGVVAHPGAEAWQPSRLPGASAAQRDGPGLLAVRRALKAAWAEETAPRDDPADAIDWRGTTEDETKRLIWALVTGYVGSAAGARTEPMAVEQAFSVPIPGCVALDGEPWTLVGRYDLVETDGAIRDMCSQAAWSSTSAP